MHCYKTCLCEKWTHLRSKDAIMNQSIYIYTHIHTQSFVQNQIIRIKLEVH
jgi:hypothetical protein